MFIHGRSEAFPIRLKATGKNPGISFYDFSVEENTMREVTMVEP